MSQDAKFFSIIGAVSMVLIIGAVVFLSKGATPAVDTTKPVDNQQLITQDSWQTASASAKVNLVEFGDFQCPACGAHHPILKRLVDEYKDRINLVWRHFPLPMHLNAVVAAEAAEAAGEQGKFWEMHDKLFENQTKWAEATNFNEIFRGFAIELGLDITKYDQAISQHKYLSKVQADKSTGDSIGVNSTPTFYLNNLKVTGSTDYQALKNQIDLLLK